MTETQFISWLKGLLTGKNQLSAGEIAEIKATLSQIRSSTNESFPSSGKQILHG
jgi:hypothetical protein